MTVSRHWMQIFQKFLHILKANDIRNDYASKNFHFGKFFFALVWNEMSKMSNSAKTSRIGDHFAPLDELNTNQFTEIRFSS